AVIGRGVSFKVWQHASRNSEQELLSISDELCSRGLLLCSDIGAFPAIAGSADYVFSHDQIRRVAYDRLTPPRLRFYHSRVAEALTALESDSPEALAYHWTAAQVWDKAVDFHQQAGDRAMQVYALADALAHYTQALDGSGRLSGAPDLSRQFELRLAREKIFALQGARQPQTQELAALAELAEALNDDRRRAEVALRRARQAQLTSDFLPAIAAASHAISLAVAAQDVPIQTESHIEWGWALLMQGEHAAALSQFEEALALAQQAGLRALEADGLHGLGTVCLVTGDYAAAKVYFQQVLDIASQIDIRPRQGSTLANLGYIATAQGDHAASKEFSQQALRIHRETGDQRGAALVMQNLADEFLAEGDFHTARDYLEQALDIQQVTQAQDNVGGILGALGFLFHRLGDYHRAEQYYMQAMTIFNELGIRWYQGQNLAYLSLLHHHLGDNQAARQYSQQGLEIAQEIGDRLAQGWLLDSLGHALAGLGQYDDARQVYQQALKLRQEQDEAHKAAESLAGLARLALIQGDTAAASQYVEEILRIQNQRGLVGANEPFRIYLTCYHVLQACQDSRAETVLNEAYAELSAQKAKILDQDLEYSFIENVAAHRELSAAYHAWQSRQQGRREQVSLPRADVPGGRPLRADEYTLVTWTVSAPGDEQIPGNAARRQQRLLRLLSEAQAQGASPTYDHLAQALEVSTRTIERDMLALRQQGAALPPTRKKLSP
ncbi:MAG: tetratricopeptide repeat protein, partial [Anaerolineales bacterium]|nr:tetratricopeptide repeat protein [Anaerolineales bacterium]